jgi:hypothetical protein
MVYQTHPAFIEPHDRAARLWRYMDLPRLLSVFDKRALFFPSIATLAEADPYEGEPALAKIHAAQKRGTDELRKLQLESEVFKHLNFFSCWHMNDAESDAMWKIYVEGEGVAIQSTVDCLMRSFRDSPDIVYLGEVQYIDYSKLNPPLQTFFTPSDYMFKRLAFQHEQEVRAGTYRSDVRLEFFNDVGLLKIPAAGMRAEDILLTPQRKGVYVSVDVATLIERVVVSPFAPTWFSDLVGSLCRRFGCTLEVVSSEMSRPAPLSLG